MFAKTVSFAVLSMFLATGSALADGWRCQTQEKDLVVKAYNQTSPEAGTRNAAVMIFSDPTVAHGRKTIAVFKAEKGKLANSAAAPVSYFAKADLRVTETSRKGELLSGTKLGNVRGARMRVYFDYARPMPAGLLVVGTLDIYKRDGSKIERNLECERYLKN